MIFYLFLLGRPNILGITLEPPSEASEDEHIVRRSPSSLGCPARHRDAQKRSALPRGPLPFWGLSASAAIGIFRCKKQLNSARGSFSKLKREAGVNPARPRHCNW